MTRIVDGVQVELSPEDEAATLAEWAANDPTKNPPPESLLATAFLDRLTPQEVDAVMARPALAFSLTRLVAAGAFDPADPRVRDGLQEAITEGIITETRANELLAPP